MTKNEIERLLRIVMAGFPHLQKHDLKPTGELWREALSDVTYDKAEKALVQAMQSAEYVPSVASIRKALGDLSLSKKYQEAARPVINRINPRCAICQDYGVAFITYNTGDFYDNKPVFEEAAARCFCAAGRGRTDLGNGWPVLSAADYTPPGYMLKTATDVTRQYHEEE